MAGNCVDGTRRSRAVGVRRPHRVAPCFSEEEWVLIGNALAKQMADGAGVGKKVKQGVASFVAESAVEVARKIVGNDEMSLMDARRAGAALEIMWRVQLNMANNLNQLARTANSGYGHPTVEQYVALAERVKETNQRIEQWIEVVGGSRLRKQKK